MADRWAKILRESFAAAVAAVHPATSVRQHLPPPPAGDILVIGAGKAAAGMAQAVENHYPPTTKLRGLIIAPHGATPPSLSRLQMRKTMPTCRSVRATPPSLSRLQMRTAAHPLPDAAGARACRQLLTQVRRADKNDLLLALISGGGSSLLGAPMAGGRLADNRRLINDLLNAGADVREINIVRRHISAALGGRLAAMCAAPVTALIMSDVFGDNPADIASGPCAPDISTCADALAVLRRHRIAVPPMILNGLKSGAWETPSAGKYFAATQNIVIADARQGLAAAADSLRQNGVKTVCNWGERVGAARKLALSHHKKLESLAQQPRPAALISGGEATTAVSGDGRGGRNTEFALHLWEKIAPDDAYVLACDTDGIDGKQQAAGALFGPGERTRAAKQGLTAQNYLRTSDSGGFFAAINALVCTGATGVNISDYRVCLLI